MAGKAHPAARDSSAAIRRQFRGNDARPTRPPGGYPQTAGGNPDKPAARQASDEPDTGVATSGPGPYSTAAAMAHTSRADY